MAVKPEHLGTVTLSPSSPVLAGVMGTWTLTMTVGKHGVDDGSSIIVARRDVSDWDLPQFDRPQDSGYTTVSTTGDVSLEISYDPVRYIRPWRAALVVDVYDGSLKEGDTVTITYGDRSQGSPGIRAQTFPENRYLFKVLVDGFGTGMYYEIPECPTLQIVGGYPDELNLVAPSTVTVGEPFDLGIRVLDSWGNPSGVFDGIVEISSSREGLKLSTRSIHLTPADGGSARIEGAVLTTPGVHRLQIQNSDLTGTSNPILCRGAGEANPDNSILWGDMHGQTEATVGTGTVEEYLAFARTAGYLDFTGWQGNDFQVTKEDWEEVREAFKRHYEPGKFVTFLGYEWSGLSPAGGDYNIHFLKDDQQIYRSSHWEIEDDSDIDTDRYPISELWKTFGDRRDVMGVPHVGGRHANQDFLDPRFCPIIEVHSHHGTFEWMIEDAIERGHIVGFSGGSDDHTGRPGLSYPTLNTSRSIASFDVHGGYTAVFALERTREAIWEALFKRHCYATSGTRLFLDVRSGHSMMGDQLSAPTPPPLRIHVIGTAPILDIEVYRGTQLVHRAPVRRPQDLADRRIQILWSGVRVKSRRKKVVWDGVISVQDGYIAHAKPIAFDRADEGITQFSNQLIQFKSSTSGDIDGVILDVRGDRARVTFSSPHTQFTVPTSEIGFEPHIVDAGGTNQQVRVCQTSAAAAPLEYEFEFKDDSLEDGVNPYWVRVVQEDGHLAWSSPIYVTRA